MKIFVIAFSILFLFFFIGNVELSSLKGIVYKDRSDSYESCIRLIKKAPYINLKCENLKEIVDKSEEKLKEKSETVEIKIKTLYLGKNSTKKVNKSEEVKLRNLIQKLSNDNKLRIK